MRKTLLLFLLLGGLIFESCETNNPHNAENPEEFIDYWIGEDQLVVVYVDIEENTPSSQAKEKAIQRASEIALASGYRYLQVISEENIIVARTKNSSMPPPRNLYQELIVEGDFPPRDVDSGNQVAKMYPGLKILVVVYKNRPLGNAIDICDYTQCPDY